MSGHYADYSLLQREYAAALAREETGAEESFRVSLQSSFTIEPLAAFLWRAAAGEGLRLRFQVGGFDQYFQELSDPDGPLHRFGPRMVFLFAALKAGQAPAEWVERMRDLAVNFPRLSEARLVVANLIRPLKPFRLLPGPEAEEVGEANRALERELAGRPGVEILDLDGLAAFHGLCRVSVPKLRYLGQIDLSPSFMEVVARSCLTHLRLLVRPARKVLVLDLDNTLWGGVVGEDGPHGLSLAPHGPGSEYADFQRAILDLHRRGVVLALNSKNNRADALEVLENHPHMVLRPGHFASLRINWQDKAANLEEIAAELNLGLESLVFLDDSPAEREWVRQRLPQVLTPDLPPDPALYPGFLEELDVFESASATKEDLERNRMYAQEAQRSRLKAGSANLEEFLRSLEMVLTVEPLREATFNRAVQLLAKTNQFNLTTRRHSESRLAQLWADPAVEIQSLSVRDKFGESGLTGLAILSFEGARCLLETFLLSCRILGRRIEEAFLSVLAEKAGRRARVLVGLYNPTPKNRAQEDFYLRAGFRPAGLQGETRLFERDLGRKPDPPPHFLRIEVKD